MVDLDTQLEQRTGKAEFGGEAQPIATYLKGFPGPLSTPLLLGLSSEIVNLQKEKVTVHTSIGAIEFGYHVNTFQRSRKMEHHHFPHQLMRV